MDEMKVVSPEITKILIFLGLSLMGRFGVGFFLYFKIAFTFFTPLKALHYCQNNCTFGANTEGTIIHDDKEDINLFLFIRLLLI